MEQVYRKRSTYAAAGRQKKMPHAAAYKQTVIRQSVLCLALFVVCLFAKVSPEPQLNAVRQSIRLILDTQTDFTAVPGQLRSLFQTYILRQSTERELASKEDVAASLLPPVEAPVSSPFGMRTHPTNGTEAFHYGIDLGAAEGEMIKCAAAGTVAEAGESPDYGQYILVSHTDELYTLYAHCQKVLPAAGDAVSAGQVIATVGATGNATGPHLHFEVRSGETWLDPAELIDFKQDDAHD